MGGGELFTISVSLDVYKKLEGARQSFKESHDAIARRLLRLPASETRVSSSGQGLWHKGVLFPEGMKLRRSYKGNLFEMIVRDRRLWMADKSFLTPARAAVEVTHSPVNAWMFWEYFDERTQRWESIDRLRKKR